MNTTNALNLISWSTVMFSTATHWQVTPALICFVAESSGTPLHLGLHGINTAGCLRRWPQNPCWHNFPADGNYALPILTVTNREVTATAGWSRKKNVVTQADMHCIQLGLHAPLSDAVAAQLWNHPLPPPAIPGNTTALAFFINGQYKSQRVST